MKQWEGEFAGLIVNQNAYDPSVIRTGRAGLTPSQATVLIAMLTVKMRELQVAVDYSEILRKPKVIKFS